MWVRLPPRAPLITTTTAKATQKNGLFQRSFTNLLKGFPSGKKKDLQIRKSLSTLVLLPTFTPDRCQHPNLNGWSLTLTSYRNHRNHVFGCSVRFDKENVVRHSARAGGVPRIYLSTVAENVAPLIRSPDPPCSSS